MAKKKKKDTPEYRVYAFANIDLQENMEAKPYVLSNPGRVKWEVQPGGDGKYVAMGTIKLPVTMFFQSQGEEGEDLICDRVVINGDTVFDSAPAHEGFVYDPTHGVDGIRAMADARHMQK